MIANFIHPGELLNDQPFHRFDHVLRYAMGLEATHYLRDLRLWGYNPYFLAGFPSPLSEGLGNHITTLALALTPPALRPQGFKLLVTLTFLVAPGLAALAARRDGPVQAVLVLALGVGFWQLDALCYRFRWFGGFPFLLASFLAPLAVASFAALLTRPDPRRVAGAALAHAVVLFLHPTASLAVLLADLGALAVLLLAGRPGRAALLAVAAAAGLAVLVNLPVLWPILRFRHLIEPVGFFGQTDRASLLGDVWAADGHFVLVALLVLAAWGLLVAAGRQGALAAAHAVALIGLLFLALRGTQIGLGALEPSRLLVPLGAMALRPAAWGLVDLADLRRARGRIAAPALAALLALPFLLVPGYRPLEPDVLVGSLYTRERDSAARLVAWLGQHTDRGARFALEAAPPPHKAVWSSNFPALLPHLVPRELLGGPFATLQTRHRHVQFVAGRVAGVPLDAAQDELREVLERYNVGWLGVTAEASRRAAAAHPALLEPLGDIDGELWLYRVKAGRGWFREGGGELRADYDRIEVRGAQGAEQVLKYHWLETLRTLPPLPLERAEVPGDPVGFIRVRNGTRRDFVVVNGG